MIDYVKALTHKRVFPKPKILLRQPKESNEIIKHSFDLIFTCASMIQNQRNSYGNIKQVDCFFDLFNDLVYLRDSLYCNEFNNPYWFESRRNTLIIGCENIPHVSIKTSFRNLNEINKRQHRKWTRGMIKSTETIISMQDWIMKQNRIFYERKRLVKTINKTKSENRWWESKDVWGQLLLPWENFSIKTFGEVFK